MMTWDEVALLRESVDFEAKAAQGIDGRGELPKSFWETYSAFANTEGGLILLGAEELQDGSLRPIGMTRPDKVQKDLWSTLNNRQKVSVDLLREADVQVLEGGMILVRVPRADRLALATAALEGAVTHRRLHEMSELHSRDLTVRLQGLVRRNFLVPEGGLRNRSYRLPEGSLPYPVGPLFGQVGEEQVEGSVQSSVQSEELQAIVAPLHGLRRFPKPRMEQIILRLCAIRPLTLKQLSILLERSPETIRTHFLNPMVQQGRLLLEYPDKPSHPDQAYRSKPGDV